MNKVLYQKYINVAILVILVVIQDFFFLRLAWIIHCVYASVCL